MQEREPRDPVEIQRIRERMGPVEVEEGWVQALLEDAKRFTDGMREDLGSGKSLSMAALMEMYKNSAPSRWLALFIESYTAYHFEEGGSDLIEQSQSQLERVAGALLVDFGTGIKFIVGSVITATADYSVLASMRAEVGIQPEAQNNLMEEWSRERVLLQKDPTGFLLIDSVFDGVKMDREPIQNWEAKSVVIEGAKTGVAAYKELYPLVMRHYAKQN